MPRTNATMRAAPLAAGPLLAAGHDLVDLAALAPRLERAAFTARVFTEAEAAYARGRAGTLESFGARWAAKEAAVKALTQLLPGTGFAPKDLARLRDFEVVAAGDGRGAPTLRLHGRALALWEALAARRDLRASLSLSHDGGYASAFVVILGVGKASRA